MTYNRGELIQNLLTSLSRIEYTPFEVIVVDNHSDVPVKSFIGDKFPAVTVLEMEENIGVGGRNSGIAAATGDIIITLDDDILGIDDAAIQKIIDQFSDPVIGAVCFKVLDPEGNISNWCHHYSAESFADKTFITNEITEGAVCFRKETLEQSGLYPDFFFISHEGPDLAYRIMNAGYNVIYSPEITVIHYHSSIGRKNWRRYYYDTRNQFWLAARNYPLTYAVKSLSVGLMAMLIYSIRDGFFIYWLKGVAGGIKGLRHAYKGRSRPTARTLAIVREIDRNRPAFISMVKKRLFQKQVRI
ncbi:MAG: glycosyltransferase family 2 protein [Proteobacteria bacterium]|nr:glycosyltransferase family 2 protein [Pseudomonadota bacterium]